MKLHNNSWFGGVLIVAGPQVNFFKLQGLIERARSPVGRPDLEKNRALGSFEVGSNQRAPDALTPVFRCDSQVQKLVFTRKQCTSDEEAGDMDAAGGHKQIVIQVPDRIPLRRLGRSRLYCKDCT